MFFYYPTQKTVLKNPRFIAVWFTQASNLWAKSENLWEGLYPSSFYFWVAETRLIRCLHPGVFELIAAIMIFVMGISMLKMDRGELHASTRLSTIGADSLCSKSKMAHQAGEGVLRRAHGWGDHGG